MVPEPQTENRSGMFFVCPLTLHTHIAIMHPELLCFCFCFCFPEKRAGDLQS